MVRIKKVLFYEQEDGVLELSQGAASGVGAVEFVLVCTGEYVS